MRVCYASGTVRKIKGKWVLVNGRYETAIPVSVDVTLSLLEGRYVEIMSDIQSMEGAKNEDSSGHSSP